MQDLIEEGTAVFHGSSSLVCKGPAPKLPNPVGNIIAEGNDPHSGKSASLSRDLSTDRPKMREDGTDE
jgi:hypothetical protein